MSAPLVSIVVTSYNYAHFIRNAIDSALAQSYPNLEVVVTDNQSTDNTLEVLGSYRHDPRVRVHVNPTNIDITPNINAGISLAQGDFVTILSADDMLLPGHTSRLVGMAQANPHLGMVYGNALFADAAGLAYSVRNVFGQVQGDYLGRRNEFPYLLAACYVCLPTVLFPRRLFEKYGLFDETIRVASDWEICLRYAAGDEQFGYTATPLAAIRMHGGQQSAYGYQASGAELIESLDVVERYIVPEHAHRFAGYEALIVNVTRDRRDRLGKIAAEALTPELLARVQRVEHRLVTEGQRARKAAKSPTVSVIVTSIGRVPLLGHALSSLAAQTYPNWEATIVQDAGFDMSTFVASLPRGADMRVVRPAQQLGPPGAKSVGMTLVDGDYTIFLDEDDEFAPDHLATLIEAIQSGGSEAAVSATTVVFDEYAEGLYIRRPIGRTDELRPLAPRDVDIEVANCVPLGSVMLAKSLLQRLLRFDPNFGLFSEWEFLLRAWSATRFAPTRQRTFYERAGLGLKSQVLASRLPLYLGGLSQIHSAYPPTSLDVLQRRERHRARVEQVFARQPQLAALEGLIDLYTGLSGADQAAAVRT